MSKIDNVETFTSMRSEVESLGINFDELSKLNSIGGHKIYHLEDSALIHTKMVVDVMKRFSSDKFMLKLAWLHDIGKIYTSICHGENDWEYPDHSTCGGFRGILCKFIPESDPDFKRLQWYISNHIKPLFWKGKFTSFQEIKDKQLRYIPDGCSLEVLRDLALCDIRGSISTVDNSELESYLIGLK